mgnify:CR=1 FL=1
MLGADGLLAFVNHLFAQRHRPVIQLHDVTKTYRSLIPPKPVVALAGMTLSFDAGEVVGIVGPNGAGKSTMLSLVLGFLSPTAGSVDIDGMKPRRFALAWGAARLEPTLRSASQIAWVRTDRL